MGAHSSGRSLRVCGRIRYKAILLSRQSHLLFGTESDFLLNPPPKTLGHFLKLKFQRD